MLRGIAADSRILCSRARTRERQGVESGKFLTTGLPLREHGYVRQATAWEGDILKMGRCTGDQMPYSLLREMAAPKREHRDGNEAGCVRQQRQGPSAL